MATYFMFGDYSSEGIKEISAKRTEKCNDIFERLGGKVKSIYALIGSHDMVIIVDKGRLVAAGCHDDLLETCEHYRHIFERVPGAMSLLKGLQVQGGAA